MMNSPCEPQYHNLISPLFSNPSLFFICSSRLLLMQAFIYLMLLYTVYFVHIWLLCINFLSLTYLHSSVVAALLHMQQSAGLAACPELDLQASGTGGVRGRALQCLSQEDVTFRALLQGVVQTASTIQGQGGVCCHVCGRKRISSVPSDFANVLQPIVKLIFPLRSWRTLWPKWFSLIWLP